MQRQTFQTYHLKPPVDILRTQYSLKLEMATRKLGEIPVVRFRTTFSNTVYDVMRSRPGWKETNSEVDWDVQWADREWIYEVFDTVKLENGQRLNHFRNGRELCRKDLLMKNLKKKKRALVLFNH